MSNGEAQIGIVDQADVGVMDYDYTEAPDGYSNGSELNGLDPIVLLPEPPALGTLYADRARVRALRKEILEIRSATKEVEYDDSKSGEDTYLIAFGHSEIMEEGAKHELVKWAQRGSEYEEKLREQTTSSYQATTDTAIELGHLAVERLLMSDIGLIKAVAKEYKNLGVPMEDLILEGCAGYRKGVLKFNFKKGAKVSTYARFWVNKSIQQAVYNQDRTIRIPVDVHENRHKVKKRVRRLAGTLGRKPTLREVAEYIDLELDLVVEVINNPRYLKSLDEPDGKDEDREFGESIASDDEPVVDTATQNVVEDGLADELTVALSNLTDNQRLVLRLRYGEYEMEYPQIGQVIQRTAKSASRIGNDALELIRNSSQAQELMKYLQAMD